MSTHFDIISLHPPCLKKAKNQSKLAYSGLGYIGGDEFSRDFEKKKDPRPSKILLDDGGISNHIIQ